MKNKLYPVKILSPVSIFAAFLLSLPPSVPVQAHGLAKQARTAFYQTAEEITVTGTVRDDQGALPGASILIKNTNKGTTTDANGSFRIQANRGDVLVFSMIGYQAQEQVVSSGQLNVTLAADTKQLNEV
ncbi:MAG: carboxypeptidase-like regulatory domain-containing protein, partial [Bacteroidota bacterium]|nr:carboxypeptidase-like regulatory domain-containing protein [Bacteroidota bacterium]